MSHKHDGAEDALEALDDVDPDTVAKVLDDIAEAT